MFLNQYSKTDLDKFFMINGSRIITKSLILRTENESFDCIVKYIDLDIVKGMLLDNNLEILKFFLKYIAN